MLGVFYICSFPINTHFSLRTVSFVHLTYQIWSWFPWWHGGHDKLQSAEIWPCSYIYLFYPTATLLLDILCSSWDTYAGHNNVIICMTWQVKYDIYSKVLYSGTLSISVSHCCDICIQLYKHQRMYSWQRKWIFQHSQ